VLNAFIIGMFMKNEDYEVARRGVMMEVGWVVVCAGSSCVPVKTVKAFFLLFAKQWWQNCYPFLKKKNIT
jgi:hypothetical protein